MGWGGCGDWAATGEMHSREPRPRQSRVARAGDRMGRLRRWEFLRGWLLRGVTVARLKAPFHRAWVAWVGLQEIIISRRERKIRGKSGWDFTTEARRSTEDAEKNKERQSRDGG